MTKQSTYAYNVYLNGRRIDTVWFTGYTTEEARKSLIEHDGYDARITVRREVKRAANKLEE